MPRQDIRYHVHYMTTLGRRFLATEDGEDSAAGPSQRTYLAESSAEASAERSQQLATLTKNKTNSLVHRRSQESKKRTRKSSTVESTGILHKSGIRLALHVTVVLYCSLDSQ